jgi:chromosome segregation ATPase
VTAKKINQLLYGEKMKTRIVYYFIGMVISALALTSVASLSTYTHESNNNLLATQAQLQALQKNYDQLKADHESLNNDYSQAKSDLEAANSKLEATNGKVASLESELKTTKEQNETLAQKINTAKRNMDVLDGLFDDSISQNEINARVTATGNSELSKKWNAIDSQDSLGKFILYLVHVVWQSLN